MSKTNKFRPKYAKDGITKEEFLETLNKVIWPVQSRKDERETETIETSGSRHADASSEKHTR